MLGKKAAEAWKLPDVFKRLMEISPATDYANLLDPLEKATFMAAVVVSSLLEIPFPEAAKANAQRCYTDVGGTQNLLLRHASPDALTKLKAHPFAQLASV